MTAQQSVGDSFGSALELAQKVRSREVSAVEVTRSYLQRIRRFDEALGCFLCVDEKGALAAAQAVDEKVRDGADEELVLAGVPVGIKDMLCTEGLATTAGSKILAGFVPPYDATVVAKLRDAGAIIIGKCNLDEFAMGSSNENSAYKPCKNPWDLTRVPGGSSGGSAAAVAASLCPISLGTDTGGSIRQPAALCGITGMKPTYGRVSRYGVIAFASSLDQVGPLGTSAIDVAQTLQVIGGHDSHDATSLAMEQPDYLAACQRPLVDKGRRVRIGVPKEYFAKGLDPRIERCVRDAMARLERDGAELVDVSLPLTEHAVAIYYLVATAEASSNLSRYDGVRYGLRVTAKEGEPLSGPSALVEMYKRTRAAGFGPEVRRRVMLGTYVLRSGYYDAYYRRASQVRTLVARDFAAAFARCDVLLTPTSPVLPFRLGERLHDPLAMYLSDIYTIGCNLAGLPGLSMPCGFVCEPGDEKPLPVGLQILGPALHDAEVLRVAAAYQRLTDWHTRRPTAYLANKEPA
jgi:aspartyl-tRNA(Asn)/glutamyl-tRNA(Gln) amidotransferase subunit A